ncbi:hypothetical protein CVT24_013393 [Panaeolus cyanescens]|uniref:N-acetyltransferase domain-containing protein n=1 Tax=Panaeolus cyanescens TaxID=181874 RepID=A0A409YMK9_9AGAR|nr:hypothetical protein CVT24_013393 [Panaeolus cyanescens]
MNPQQLEHPNDEFKFTLRTARTEDLTTIRDLVTEVFLASEPTSSYLKISPAGFHLIYNAFVPEVDLSTTVLAEESRTGEIAAVLVNAPYASHVDTSIKEGLAFQQILHEFYEPLKSCILIPQGIPESRVLHCALAATRLKYEGHGLFKAILRETLKIATMDPRWDIAMAEITSPISRHVFVDLFYWNEGHVIRYRDYEIDGKKPFEHLEGEAVLGWTNVDREKPYHLI